MIYKISFNNLKKNKFKLSNSYKSANKFPKIKKFINSNK